MTAQVIKSKDYVGRHNSDLSKSGQRIKESGTWKRQRVIEIMPSSERIFATVAHSHRSLGFPPNQAVFRHLALGEEVGEAYSNAIAEVLAHPDLKDWEYLLTMECDNAPPGNGLTQLIQDLEQHPELSCVGGLYWCKGEEGVPHIWGDPDDPVLNFRPQYPKEPYGLQECCGTSMGFNLWRISMFKDERLRKPWFKTIGGNPEDKGMGTQDLYFWGDARKYGYRCAVDTRVLVGHYDGEGKYGPKGTMW